MNYGALISYDYDRKVTLPRLIRAKYTNLQSICYIDITAIFAGIVITYYDYKLLVHQSAISPLLLSSS